MRLPSATTYFVRRALLSVLGRLLKDEHGSASNDFAKSPDSVLSKPSSRIAATPFHPLRLARGSLCIGLLLTAAVYGQAKPAPTAQQPRAQQPRAQQPTAQRQTREQERARAMATELVSSVLDVQLRQLEENQLTSLPIYGEIKAMRGNLRQLVEDQMQGVVALLVESQRAEGAERERLNLEARGAIRGVVVALMAERQKLYKRMHLAKLAAQLRQLIDAESKVVRITQSLPQEAPRSREKLTLGALEDQRDVTAIHFQFVDVVIDVATWDGAIGAGASKAVRLLKTLKMDRELQTVDQALAAGQFVEAEKSQQAAIRGWRSLLAIIEETQGLAGSDQESLAKFVQSVIQQQEAVREQSRQADPQDLPKAEQLAQEQHAVQEQLGQLAAALSEIENTEALTEQAKAAAFEAEAKLFEGALPEAVQQQGQVLGALAEIEKRLEQASETRSDKTAEELAQEVQRLEQLDQALTQVRAKQAEAMQHAAEQPAAAKAQEDQVAQQLQQANQAADFGTALETRLADAQDEVAQAQVSLANASPEMAADRREATRDATESVDRVAAEVKQELADSRREQLAVQVGELARAAEALERAAAAEHTVADAAMQSAESDGWKAEELARVTEEQARVREVAKDIAEGVKVTSPQTAQQLAAAEPKFAAIDQQLAAAKQAPGEATKPAARETAQQARAAAQELTAAAKQLREQAGTSAETLAALAKQQLAPVVAARDEVEKMLAAVDAPAAPIPAVTPLREALEKTKAAQREQLRASGKESAAQAQQLVQDLQNAMTQQQAADRAARDFAHGRAHSPLRAAEMEEQVSDAARAVAENASAPIAQELRAAADSAEEAAKEMLVGNPNTAAEARKRTRDAFQRARQAANKAAEEAAALPAAEPDAEAQAKVSALIAEAQQAALDDAPAAKAGLETAEQQSQAAAKALAAQQPPVAADAQQKTAAALEQSAAALQEAIASAAKQQTERAAELQRDAEKLARQAVEVDAGAAVALDQAAAEAAEAATPEPNSADPAPMPADPIPAVSRGLERATASLAARAQELDRDREIAESIAQLAKTQQVARDQIAEQSAKLTGPEKARGQEPAATATPAEMAAAETLAQATDDFAEAQRATGEGAAEISGQSEVANQPIREGLAAASQLGQLPETDMPLAATDPPPATDATPAAEPMPSDLPADAVAQPDAEPPADLGTDFVPNSPEETARRIAGNEALRAAAEMLAQREPRGPQALDGEATNSAKPLTGQDPQSVEGEVDAAQKTQSARQGESAASSAEQGKNEALDPARIEQTADEKTRDARADREESSGDVKERRFEEEPWFAKLPPSLQKAIQAKSRRGPPRGYEERLKRYFESVD